MEGYKTANAIIGKVVKNQNDDITIWCPSAFVTSSAKKAEKKLIVAMKAEWSPFVLV